MNKQYKYLIIGCGLAGASFAALAKEKNEKTLILERDKHIGGMCYTEKRNNTDIHIFGPHIFHTSNKEVWDFVNKYSEFNHFINQPKAKCKDKLYSLPYNMNTFYELFKATTPAQAKEKLQEEINKANIQGEPKNFEEVCLKSVGKTLYNTLIKGYTTKQWMTKPNKLPASLASRIPVRFSFDNNYFNHYYQGIPTQGYTQMFLNMINGLEIRVNENINSLEKIKEYSKLAEYVIYTGSIDELLDFKYGELNYRTLKFEIKETDTDNYQGVAVMNYSEQNIPYTRVIEHKYFNMTENNKNEKSIISYEYPAVYHKGDVKYYPSLVEKDIKKYLKYEKEITKKIPNIHLLGRIAQYKYFDMDKVIEQSFNLFNKLENN